MKLQARKVAHSKVSETTYGVAAAYLRGCLHGCKETSAPSGVQGLASGVQHLLDACEHTLCSQVSVGG